MKSVAFLLVRLWVDIWEVSETRPDSCVFNVVDETLFFFKLVLAVFESWVCAGLLELFLEVGHDLQEIRLNFKVEMFLGCVSD